MKMKTMKKRIIICAFVCTVLLIMLPSISAVQYDSMKDSNTMSLLKQHTHLKILKQNQDIFWSGILQSICSFIFWLRVYKFEKWVDRSGFETHERAGGFRIDHVIPFFIACIACIRLLTWELFCTILQNILNWDGQSYSYF